MNKHIETESGQEQTGRKRKVGRKKQIEREKWRGTKITDIWKAFQFSRYLNITHFHRIIHVI